MELHAEQREPLVADAHDLAAAVRRVAPGADLELVGKRVGLDHQAVVAGGGERVFQAFVQVAVVVVDLVGLAVHQPAGADDLRPERLADRLVPQAHAQQRNLPGKALDARHGNAGLVGRAGAGRNDQVRRPPGLDLLQRDLVVAVDLQLQRRVELAQPLHEVVGERVVVVDQQDHGIPHYPQLNGQMRMLARRCRNPTSSQGYGE